jgi:hypothetical protein
MQVSLVGAWAWWVDGRPGLRDAELWGLAIKWWGVIGGIVLLLGVVALAVDVAASPRSHERRRGGIATYLLRAVILVTVVVGVVGYVHAFREEMQETGHSAAYVASAGNDNIAWNAAPRWYDLTLPSLTALAAALYARARLQDWLTTTLQHGPKAVLPRLLAALVLLAALNFAILAA